MTMSAILKDLDKNDTIGIFSSDLLHLLLPVKIFNRYYNPPSTH